jgi:hypothetical protein
MPYLNADALRDDPDGLAFLKAVLQPPPPRQAATPVIEKPRGPSHPTRMRHALSVTGEPMRRRA